eukprot:1577756-Pyramimonas_sp.AAC.1
MGFGPHARAESCEMCGERFFPSSLKFHQKVCAKKHMTTELPCPYCDRTFWRIELQAHVQKCGKLRGPLTKDTRVQGNQSRRSSRGKTLVPRLLAAGVPSVDELPIRSSHKTTDDSTIPAWIENGAEPEGLLPCAICKRTFAADRLAKHQSICRANLKHRNRGVFDTAQQRLGDVDMSDRSLVSPTKPRRPQGMHH